MCGLTGLVDPTWSGGETELAALAGAMARTLSHRGPDDEGVWADPAAGVGLGHRRLSVIDVSDRGHQPMVSASGRLVLVYNGEIYNFPELRRELEQGGHRFGGRSDTEVLLAALEAWGIDRALRRLNGMFAFAVWDRQARMLHLARDRMGEKPLYHGLADTAFVFGSELKALLAHPRLRPEVGREALAMFLRYGYVPTPHSILTGISKLPPGTRLEVRAGRRGIEVGPPVRYWDLMAVAEEAERAPGPAGTGAAVDELEELLIDAVRMRLISDVPLGSFLSGGIDSSLVVALMQAHGGGNTRTFTIGSANPAYDEAGDARAVAAHLGTDHTELEVTDADALSVVQELPRIYDEPFGDWSQIPTVLVSRLARRHVTVCLSGDGGDELFAGYNRYRWAPSMWSRTRWLPHALRRAAGSGLTAVPIATWDTWYGRVAKRLPGRAQVRLPGEKIAKLGAALPATDLADLHHRLSSHWNDPGRVVVGASRSQPNSFDSDRLTDPVRRMTAVDAVTNLPEDLLVKVDRASMSASLEVRVPLLDPRVVEWAFRLPTEMKIRGAVGKWPLRQVLDRYVPAELVERPKMGFGLPMGDLLRGPLRAWAEELLAERRLRSDGYLEPAPVRRAWKQHVAGQRDSPYQLWDVLMFQAWLDELRPRS